jgi:hypothetical protein
MAEERKELTIKEAREAFPALDLQNTVLSQYLKVGRLKGRKIGNTWVIDVEDLKRFLATPRKPGPPAGQPKKSRDGGHSSPA